MQTDTVEDLPAPTPPPEEAAPVEAVETPKPKKTPLEELEVGGEVQGKIRSVMSYGAFVDIGASTDALLHVSEISNEFVKDATEKLTVGEAISAKIKAINLEKKQLALTMKGSQPSGEGKTPLEELEVGAEVQGTVRSVTTYGAFVNIGASKDALLHVSEISDEFLEDATEKFTAGDTISAKIKGVNSEKQQIALTMREPQVREPRAPRPKVDLSKYEGADEKEFVTGKVNSITDFGAFVTLEEGVDGLVHISQVQEGGVGKVSDVLEVGQEVQVRVIKVDTSKRRIALSMLEWKERSESEGRSRGGGMDGGFSSESDKAFQMSAEELEELAVGEEFEGPFAAAFERAELVQKAKDEKKKYAPQLL